MFFGIDTSKVLTSITTAGASWIATDDGFITGTFGGKDINSNGIVYIDNVSVVAAKSTYYEYYNLLLPIKKGQTVRTRDSGSYSIVIYGVLR